MRVLVRVIPTVCAILVAAASFALSYVALRDVAASTAAVPESMAWLTPICVDGAVLAGSASLWASSMRQTKKDPVAFLTVVSLLIVSVVININHAGDDVLAKVIAALPPLTLLACLELVAGQYRRDAEDLARARQEEEERKAAAGPEAAAGPSAAIDEVAPSRPAADVAPQSVSPAPALTQPPTQPVPTQLELTQLERPAVTAPTAPLSAPVLAPSHDALTAARSSSTQPAAADVASRGQVAPVLSSAPVDHRPAEVAAPAAPAAPAEPALAKPMLEKPARAARTASGTRATAPTVAAQGKLTATKAQAGDEGSGASRIRDMFQAHLNAGGSATDPTLARTFAAELDLQQAYVRKVLGPLRRELEPATT